MYCPLNRLSNIVASYCMIKNIQDLTIILRFTEQNVTLSITWPCIEASKIRMRHGNRKHLNAHARRPRKPHLKIENESQGAEH